MSTMMKLLALIFTSFLILGTHDIVPFLPSLEYTVLAPDVFSVMDTHYVLSGFDFTYGPWFT